MHCIVLCRKSFFPVKFSCEIFLQNMDRRFITFWSLSEQLGAIMNSEISTYFDMHWIVRQLHVFVFCHVYMVLEPCWSFMAGNSLQDYHNRGIGWGNSIWLLPSVVWCNLCSQCFPLSSLAFCTLYISPGW